MQKLCARYGAGGFWYFGQGKWYPGEQLPRWALSVYWRKDGQPCWRNPALFADERLPSHYTRKTPAALSTPLARVLGLDTDCIPPGYEDVWYYLWRERQLPVNVDPRTSRLDDELERERLRRVFKHGLDNAVGYTSPIAAMARAGALAAGSCAMSGCTPAAR